MGIKSTAGVLTCIVFMMPSANAASDGNSSDLRRATAGNTSDGALQRNATVSETRDDAKARMAAAKAAAQARIDALKAKMHPRTIDKKSRSTSKSEKKVARLEPSRPFINGHYVLGPTIKTNGYHSYEPLVVVVDKGSHMTHVLQLQKDEIVRILTLSNSIGKDATPTPPGRYFVRKKELDPKWTPPKSIDPKQRPVEPFKKDRRNGLGVAKINLSKFDIVLHGTNAPGKIRKNVSHGCVRHSNNDILKLYSLVKPGTVVYIVNKWRGKVINQQDFGIKT